MVHLGLISFKALPEIKSLICRRFPQTNRPPKPLVADPDQGTTDHGMNDRRPAPLRAVIQEMVRQGMLVGLGSHD